MPGIPDALAEALADRYRLRREIGAGGMATVYLADDLKHHRSVAIKVLHPELAAVIGADRFLTEIRTTATLQHPHILPLFDSGEAGGSLFYVMPHVDGESLRDRIDREAQLPVDEALRICDGVASALDYAHRQGVIHRDVKPANILLHDGQPLVADFGIALALTSAGSGRLTETGLSLGTPHYMSPEQASGDRSVDVRSDVYALGCVLYEMLAGAPPFAGPTPQAVLAKVLTTSPGRVSAERPTVPPHVDAAIARAVERLPADRFGSVADFRAALADEAFRYDAGGAARSSAAAKGAPRRPGVPLPLAAGAAAILVALAGWGWLAGGGRGAAGPPSEFKALTLVPPDHGWEDGDFALSPDGSRIVHADSLGRIALMALDGGEDRLLVDEQGFHPTFSPDGRAVAYLAASGGLWAVDVDGGAPARIGPADPPFIDYVWAPDGYLYMGSRQGPIRIPESGGPVEPVPHPEDAVLELAEALPDGRILVEVGREGLGPLMGALDPRTGELHVWENQPEAAGVIQAFHREGLLFWADVALDLKVARFEPAGPGVIGTPIRLATRVGRGEWLGVAAGIGADGTLVFEQGASASSGVGENLGWIDMDGEITIIDPGWADQFGDIDYIALSPDQRYAALQVDATGTEATELEPSDIWVVDLIQRSSYRLTFDGRSRNPVWMPDGRIAYLRDRDGGGTQVLAQPYDRTGSEVPLLELDVAVERFIATGDGATLVLDVMSDENAGGIYLVDADDGATLRPFVESPFNEFHAALSPDGRWLAYASDESGTPRIFLRSFPAGGRPWPISRGFGIWPIWRPDSESLFFVSRRRMELALLDLSDGVDVSGRGTLFDADLIEGGYGIVHRDGERILATIEPTADQGARRLRMFVNVFAEIERRLGR